MDLSFIVSIVLDVLNFATPLLLAATGILIVEKSGVLNLGVEGMMIVGALAAYMVGALLASCGTLGFDGRTCLLDPLLGRWAFLIALAVAGLAGALLAALFGVLVLFLRANQVATGLGLTILGLSLTNAIGSQGLDITGTPLQGFVPDAWRQAPGLLRLASLNIMTLLALLILPLTLWVLTRTRGGLILRAVGENHDSAFTLGYPILRIRLLAILFGGFMSGVAGGYMSLALIGPSWREGVTNGYGWLALALILFGTWRPLRVLLGGVLFGLTISLGPRLQNAGGLPDWFVPLFLPILPYLVPVIVLTLISFDALMIRRNAPGSLGKTFEPS